jgi:lysophospholipase L1-like esterase
MSMPPADRAHRGVISRGPRARLGRLYPAWISPDPPHETGRIFSVTPRRCAGLTALGLVFACAHPHAPQAPRHVSPYAPEIAYVGRVDTRDPAGPRFGWSGTEIRIGFRATSIRLELRDLPRPPDPRRGSEGLNRFRFDLDGGAPRELYVGADHRLVYEAGGLTAGNHLLRVYKQTEVVVGTTQVTSIDLGPNGTLLPVAHSPRRIEFIGDSLTTAYGNEGKTETCHFSPDTQNHWLSYDAIAARNVGAEAQFIAWSGKGVARNYGNAKEAFIGEIYRRNLPFDAESRWDFGAFTPEVVVIDVGGNDFWDSDPTEALYVPAYRALVDDVRRAHPRAHIVCAVGPASDEWPPNTKTLTLWRSYLTHLVDAYHAAGDARVHVLEFGTITKDEPRGCDYHPGLATHARLARELTPKIKELTGW